jgi:asparagine synthase (glutamine-hydrolysing)
MALEFWKKGLDDAGKPGFSHQPRWSTTSSLKKMFSNELQKELSHHSSDNILDTLPAEFEKWDPLAQAQYLEVVTLLSSYLLSSQGDRMLMAHSVEGRFPFLDADVMEFCNLLPAEYKLIGLNEKNILKKAARGLIPDEIIDRKKQPYRAPDAISFVSLAAPGYVADMLSLSSLSESGVFIPGMANGLYQKCVGKATTTQGEWTFSNADNMGIVGVLSTQLLYHQFVKNPVDTNSRAVHFKTEIDRLSVLTP